MLDEDDSFYKQLPFTLSAEQAKPNFVIFGTGLQQCLIAAHYSKIKMMPGLILDMEKTYGSCLKTVTIKQLYSLSTGQVKVNLYEFLKLQSFKEMNQKFYADIIQNKKHRGYNIDLEPNFFFASSITCQMLKDADMDKYMDFRLVYNMLHYDQKGFKNVPLSKGKIFESKDLGLLEKKLLLNTFHSLSQIYNKFMNVQQDQNSTKQFDKQFGQVDQKLYNQFMAQRNNSFIPFIEKLTKNNQKIMNYIIYILCNYQYNHKNQKQIPEHAKGDYKLEQFIKRFGKFVKSCGIYAECPYLYVDNGIGDVPQAYSRIASIYLSTYILHPKIQIHKIQFLTPLLDPSPLSSQPQQTEQQPIKIYTNLYPQGFIETKQVFYGPTCYNLKYSNEDHYNKQYTLRVIFICKKLGMEEDCPAIVYLLDLKENENPVYLFMLDSVSHTCPEQLIIYQFETVITDKSEQWCAKKIESYIQVLHKTRGQQFKSSMLYTAAYIRQKRYPKHQSQKQAQLNHHEHILRDHSGIDLDSHFVNFKQIVGEHKYYFKKEKGQGNVHEDEFTGEENETVGLIERLHAIDIHNTELLTVQTGGQTKQQQQQQAKVQPENYQVNQENISTAVNQQNDKKQVEKRQEQGNKNNNTQQRIVNQNSQQKGAINQNKSENSHKQYITEQKVVKTQPQNQETVKVDTFQQKQENKEQKAAESKNNQ